MSQPPTIYKPGKLNYLWNYLGSSLKTLATALSPYLGGDTGVKRYKALLNQSGTDAPVATILENTLGGVPVWTRIADGYYYCTLANAFTANKTFCSVTYGPNSGIAPLVSNFGFNMTYSNNSILDLLFTVPSTGAQIDPNNYPCNDICVLIEVYP